MTAATKTAPSEARKAEYMDVAREIQRQINAGAGTLFPLMAILGVADLCALSGDSLLVSGEEIRGGLRFRTPGCKPGSRVTVELMVRDYYRVSFETVRGLKITEHARHEDIDCEQLGPLIRDHYGF